MIFGIMVDMEQKVCVVCGARSYFSAMLGALVVVLAVAWFCRFAGYDDFALCSVRRRQARGVFTGSIAATVPAACFASWDVVLSFRALCTGTGPGVMSTDT